MKKSDRFIALALCCTLTLGAFAYRPSEAKAIAGVDDAVVIGALLSAFAGGCGLIFSNNGMTSGQIADGMVDKWNEYKAAVLDLDSTFASWLGYEDMDALLQAIVLSGGNALMFPRLVAKKFAEFTNWLVQDLGLTAGGDPATVTTSQAPTSRMSKIVYDRLKIMMGKDYDFYTEQPYRSGYKAPSGGIGIWSYPYVLLSSEYPFDVQAKAKSDDYPENAVYIILSQSGQSVSARGFNSLDQDSWTAGTTLRPSGGKSYIKISTEDVPALPASDSDLSVFAPSYYKNPTIDLPVEGEEAANPTLSGVGDGTATSIEELLQKILEQLQANTLAPTLDLAGTETGGNTGTDEDAKPYLPYIPQIFEKIKELPGTLANIWETVKGIPAAIAEKIGAFFTTLWGWLQNIIDAITALPAAIAEKIGALFKPDEALLSEITDNFKGKFGFFSTLKQFGSDLFGMTPETEPPVIWVHLENAESKFGYNYGDKQKIFDMTWYQKYKASVDGLLSGFLWLGYLWLLFKRAPAILNGMQLSNDEARASANVSSAPRLGSGDGFYLGGKRE